MSLAVKVVNNKTVPKLGPMDGIEELVVEDAIPEGFTPEKDNKRSEQHSYVPDAKYAKRYVNRKVNGVLDFDLMKFCMIRGKNLLMRGDTGAGKTMMPMAYAAKFGLKYYSIPCDVSIDPTALFGKLVPTDTIGKFEWVDGPVTELVRNGGILNVSEVNFMPAKISASLYSLLDHRRALTLLGHKGEVVRAHGPRCWCSLDKKECRSKWLMVVADMNPKYRGTVELNAAFANRFQLKVDWDYDSKVENELIKSPALLGVVRNIRKLTNVRTPVGTNSMEEFLEVAPGLGFEFAVENFIAQFEPAERDGVKKALQIAEANLKRDLATIAAGISPDDDTEEMDPDAAWFAEEGDPNDFDWEDAN
jgi:AAA domain (dynein-related subfamily)